MNSDEPKKISAVLIVEVLGRPVEYLVETMNNIAEQIGKEKGVKVIGNKVNPPVPIEGQKDFYTSFSEIAVETENLLYLSILMFKYMPAHIEILSPQNISLTNNGWNDVMNELTRRLHGYDEIARIMQAEKKILEDKLRSMINGPKSEEDEEEEIKPKKNKK